MSQYLEGVDIYHCEYFQVDSSGRLKFAKGAYINRTPDSFKSITEISKVIKYCMWIIKQKELSEEEKYAATVYWNRVNQRIQNIEMEFRKILKNKHRVKENDLKKSIDKPGRKYV